MIELRHVQKIVGQSTVLDIEALAVGSGEVAAVVGPVGSGKSALLSLLTGQSQPTAGTVRVAGLDPTLDHDKVAESVGVLFAEDALYERLTVKGNLAFHCQLRGLAADRADEIIAQVGLSDHAATPASRLPHGLARRLSFGRAILHHPTVLLLMEPFAGCDAASCVLLARLIRELASVGTTVLVWPQKRLAWPTCARRCMRCSKAGLSEAMLPRQTSRPSFLSRFPFGSKAR